ncbi:RnfABCDGE type electron transport complex subunit B [Rickettsiella grylli]|uniref:Iron-sulfur cluster binding protein n=1 Tax=Rickettsiella grylli TaxID=59196 RepID=A8PKV6_9COXI|nr:RnfABCDGE type electron transport complex subunit B [Rickettsiella grylli]EDP46819.1 iron-sulfur cluster binding protein [Rickettsiella grylli]
MDTTSFVLSKKDLKKHIKEIDALLPQTQCGQCHYSDCYSYAKAIAANKAEINQCPPGGVKTLHALASLLKKEAGPFVEEMRKHERPAMTARIRESECIGCTKCIQACPVDAIVGAAKQLHVVLKQECTGCGLCIAPCPVDCIDLFTLQQSPYNPQQARQRYVAKKYRLHSVHHQTFIKKTSHPNEEMAYIHAAIKRVKEKKQRLMKNKTMIISEHEH